MSPVGPSLPPHLAPKRKREDDDSDSDDDFGPAPPKQRSRSSSSSSNNGEKRRKLAGPLPPSTTPPSKPSSRVIGPSLPPAPLDERPTTDPYENESSSDDDFGPALAPAAGTVEHDIERQRQRNFEAETTTQEAAKVSQREEWMLAPPEGSDWASKVDPTKLRNRKFNTGKGAKGPSSGGAVDMGLWTETPEQKRKRLEDEVMGVQRSGGDQKNDNRREKAEAEAMGRRIREHNEKNRNVSLYDQHTSKGPKEKEDDPSARAFDKEKDIGGGVKIGHAKRKELLTKAADFGSRFSKGNFL